jgi:hypothetical protein
MIKQLFFVKLDMTTLCTRRCFCHADAFLLFSQLPFQLHILLETLKLGYHALLSDVDVVWLRNPFLYIEVEITIFCFLCLLCLLDSSLKFVDF